MTKFQNEVDCVFQIKETGTKLHILFSHTCMKTNFIIKFLLMTQLYLADFVQKGYCGLNKMFVYATLSFSLFLALNNFILSQKNQLCVFLYFCKKITLQYLSNQFVLSYIFISVIHIYVYNPEKKILILYKYIMILSKRKHKNL